jgi:hypothetical protein
MEEIKYFFDAFLEDEFQCLKEQYNMDVEDSEYEVLREKVEQYFIHNNIGLYDRGVEIDEMEEDIEELLPHFGKKRDSIQKRTLFQIKKYKGPILGEALQRFITNNILYVGYTSYSQASDIPLYYAQLYYVMQLDSDHKIIYQQFYNLRDKKWEHSSELESIQVLDPGTLIEVKKITPPLEESSLTDYQKD